MKRRDYSSRVVWFALCVVLGVVALGVIPPFQLFGMTTARVDIMSELRAAEAVVELKAEEYIADMERLEAELAALDEEPMADADTIELPQIRYEWVENRVSHSVETRRLPCSEELIVDTKHEIVAVEDFDTMEYTKFDRFIDKLANGESVRIAFLGDSFIEGDILTSDFRAIMQERFGGRGVGFVACDIPFTTSRTSVKRTSSGWTAHSVMKPKALPEDIKDKFFVSGYLASGKAGATTRWSSTNAFPTLDSCSRARVLLYSRDSSRVTVELNDTLSRSFDIEPADYLREIYVEASVASVRLKVEEGNVLCYGASLEGDDGVVVDNYSVRSNNGHAIFGTSAKINRQADDMLHYDLVVLQYGLNIMQKGQRGYSRYRDQVRDMIAYAEACFPNAAVMVMGVSDRWVKNEETSTYESIGSVDDLTSYQRAAADSCRVTFWNTSKAMSQLGGMPTFVANGWAAGDYTHINFKGGKRIARELAVSIISQVRSVVERREAEQMRNDKLVQQDLVVLEEQSRGVVNGRLHTPVNVTNKMNNITKRLNK